MLDLEATKQNFVSFMGDPSRSQNYFARRGMTGLDTKSFPWVAVVIAFLLIITLIAIPAGLIVLFFAFRNRRTPRQKLIDKLQDHAVIPTYGVAVNSDVRDAASVGNALCVGSFSPPSTELISVCMDITDKLQKLFGGEESSSTAEEELKTFLHRPSTAMRPRSKVPPSCTGGQDIYVFDIPVEMESIDEQRKPMVIAAIGDTDFGQLRPIPLECVVWL